jgi:hypothetical protein
MADVDPLTLSREDLYELVWSKPMVELAKDFGMSDVGLAKRCRKLGIPVPGRGYWARVAAGQAPRQPTLKKREKEIADCSAQTFDAPNEESVEANNPAPVPAEYSAMRDRILMLNVPVIDNLRSASAAVKRTAVLLKRPWQREITWNRGERTGATLLIDVSEGAADRALRLCEQLLGAGESLSWKFYLPQSDKAASSRSDRSAEQTRSTTVPTFGAFRVEGESLAIRIDERRRQVDHVLTDDEKQRKRRGEYVYAPRWDLVPTGDLRIHVMRPNVSYTQRTWKDSARSRLEEQIRSVLTGLLDEAIRVKADRERDRLAEIERRRQDELRWQLAQRRDANAKLIRELEAQAGAWFRARLLRSYLRAQHRALGETKLQATRQGVAIDFLEWAQHYVDQLDPLSRRPHDTDMKEDRSSYGSGPEKLQQTLARLLGRDWQEAWKMGKTALRMPPRASSSFLHGGNDDEGMVYSPADATEAPAHENDPADEDEFDA